MEYGFGFSDPSSSPLLYLEIADAREEEAWCFCSICRRSLVSHWRPPDLNR